MLKNEIVEIVVQLCTKNHSIVHFKWVDLIVYNLFLGKAT